MEEIFERYEVKAVLGEGATAMVFLLWDRKLCRFVAAKYSRARKLLLQEGVCLNTFFHMAFPRVYDYWEGSFGDCLLLEYVAGENLKQRKQRIGSYTEKEVIYIGKSLAWALLTLHEGNPACVYGDLKPENVMIQPDGRVRLVDFGTVQPLKTDGQDKAIRGGTPLYAPPETWREMPDVRNDIYAWGRLLQALLEIEKGAPCSEELVRILERATQREKAHRYSDMHMLLNELLTCGFSENGIR